SIDPKSTGRSLPLGMACAICTQYMQRFSIAGAFDNNSPNSSGAMGVGECGHVVMTIQTSPAFDGAGDVSLAEREGFEPSLGQSPTTGLANPPLRPLEYLSAARIARRPAIVRASSRVRVSMAQ